MFCTESANSQMYALEVTYVNELNAFSLYICK